MDEWEQLFWSIDQDNNILLWYAEDFKVFVETGTDFVRGSHQAS